jgi:hypothetical protein
MISSCSYASHQHQNLIQITVSASQPTGFERCRRGSLLQSTAPAPQLISEVHSPARFSLCSIDLNMDAAAIAIPNPYCDVFSSVTLFMQMSNKASTALMASSKRC